MILLRFSYFKDCHRGVWDGRVWNGQVWKMIFLNFPEFSPNFPQNLKIPRARHGYLPWIHGVPTVNPTSQLDWSYAMTVSDFILYWCIAKSQPDFCQIDFCPWFHIVCCPLISILLSFWPALYPFLELSGQLDKFDFKYFNAFSALVLPSWEIGLMAEICVL